MGARGSRSADEQAADGFNDGDGERMPPPYDLLESERAEWFEIVNCMPADHFTPADVPLLRAYCCASALHRQARLSVHTDGMILYDERGRAKANPAAGILATQATSMALLSSKLRLSPAARTDKRGVSTSDAVGGKSGGDRPPHLVEPRPGDPDYVQRAH